MTTAPSATATKARRKRLAIIVLITLLVEGALLLTAYLGPALATLLRPVYVIVALIAVGSMWHALRRHRDSDRRSGDRRSGLR